MCPCVRSACTLARRESANMLMPMAIAAAASTPMMEKVSRRIGSVRFPLIDENRVQEQEEADEGGEIDQVAQRDDATGEVGEAVDDGDPPRERAQHRHGVRQE